MTACVLDASVVARWWLARDSDALAAPALQLLSAVRDGALEVHTPELLFAEVANAFWKSARSGDWPPASARQAAEDLAALPLRTHSLAGLVAGATSAALEYQITVYDACYVFLARREQLPLYTADRRLVDRLAPSIPSVRFLGG